MFKPISFKMALLACLALPALMPAAAQASSHMDAPLIVRDPAANTTDVYAFRSKEDGVEYMTAALGVFPFEEPGIGPNDYSFDPNVIYDIHVALGNHVGSGIADLTYRFEFETEFANRNTILQSYLGVIQPGANFSPNQNLRQTYKVTKIDHRNGTRTVLGDEIMVPPNNQGRVTPAYNQGEDGDNPAKGGVANAANLDGFTMNAIAHLPNNYDVFAGQRDDGFFADIHSIFDLDFSFDKPAGFDSQGGYNLHMMVINIPLSQLGGAKKAGVYATTSRKTSSGMVQVARQGNPLFNEALVAIKDKNLYSSSRPKNDAANFMSYATNPELDVALGLPPVDLSSIFIPDVIKVDLTTPAVRLAGQAGFNRLSVFGGDVLPSTLTGGNVAGGWPNGRRFGDDVLDIALIALGAAAPGPGVDIDKVTHNDMTYNRVFPYAPTPQNGRNHGHHGQ